VREQGPDHRGGNELQVGDQAGRQQYRPDVGAVAELENGRDQADDQGSVEFVDIVVIGVVQISDEKAEIQCQRQDNEECKQDLFQIHILLLSVAGKLWALKTSRIPPP